MTLPSPRSFCQRVLSPAHFFPPPVLLHQRSCDLMRQVLPPHLAPAAVELGPYLCQCFGNEVRIDYGTGHEVAFALLLLCLERIGALDAARDRPAMVLRAFAAYLGTVRRLHSAYVMEPAGSHGVWGLDDFHCLPFVWGAAQLRQQPRRRLPGSEPAEAAEAPRATAAQREEVDGKPSEILGAVAATAAAASSRGAGAGAVEESATSETAGETVLAGHVSAAALADPAASAEAAAPTIAPASAQPAWGPELSSPACVRIFARTVIARDVNRAVGSDRVRIGYDGDGSDTFGADVACEGLPSDRKDLAAHNNRR